MTCKHSKVFWILVTLNAAQETLFMQNLKHCLYVLPLRLGFSIVSKRDILSLVQLFLFKFRENVGNSEAQSILFIKKGFAQILSIAQKQCCTAIIQISHHSWKKAENYGWFSMSVHYPQSNIVEIFHPHSLTGVM